MLGAHQPPGNSTEHCTAASHWESEPYQHNGRWSEVDERWSWQWQGTAWTCAAPCKAVKSFPCFSTWVGEVKPFYRLDPSLSTFSINAGWELLRLEVGIYTTLSKQECIVVLVAFIVPSGECTASTRDDFRAEHWSSWQKAEYAVSRLEEGSGRESAPNSVRLVNCSQRALRKFHLNTGLAVRGSIGFIGYINDGLCWDFGKGSK